MFVHLIKLLLQKTLLADKVIISRHCQIRGNNYRRLPNEAHSLSSQFVWRHQRGWSDHNSSRQTGLTWSFSLRINCYRNPINSTEWFWVLWWSGQCFLISTEVIATGINCQENVIIQIYGVLCRLTYHQPQLIELDNPIEKLRLYLHY